MCIFGSLNSHYRPACWCVCAVNIYDLYVCISIQYCHLIADSSWTGPQLDLRPCDVICLLFLVACLVRSWRSPKEKQPTDLLKILSCNAVWKKNKWGRSQGSSIYCLRSLNQSNGLQSSVICVLQYGLTQLDIVIYLLRSAALALWSLDHRPNYRCLDFAQSLFYNSNQKHCEKNSSLFCVTSLCKHII